MQPHLLLFRTAVWYPAHLKATALKFLEPEMPDPQKLHMQLSTQPVEIMYTSRMADIQTRRNFSFLWDLKLAKNVLPVALSVSISNFNTGSRLFRCKH